MTSEQVLEAFDRAARGQIGWSEALAGLAALTGVRVGQIGAIDRQGALVVNLFSGLSEADAADYLAAGSADPRVNPRIRAVLRAPPLRAITESDFGAPDRIRHPYYAGFCARHDLPHSVLVKLQDDGHRVLFAALLRSAEAGPLSEPQRRLIEDAAPHIRDAIAAGLAQERQKIDLIGHMMDYLATPAIALNAQCQIVAFSPRAGAVLGDGRHLTARNGGLLLHSAERQRALAEAVAATCRTLGPTDRRGANLIIPAIDNGPMLIAAIAPLPIDGRGWLHTICCLAFLRRQSVPRDDLARYLAHRHLLTPSECEIALHLVEGRDARVIAGLRAVSEGTVRNQIKTVLAKTGHRRQLDLVTALRP